MAFATVSQVKEATTFQEIRELPEAKTEKYIEYANAYLRRFTGVDYRAETDPDRLVDLERVTVLLVEYLWLADQPEIKEANFTGVSSERIGSYSYNKGATSGTGNAELDQLLTSFLPGRMGFNHFSVNGPSRANLQSDHRHAYVTDLVRKRT